MVAPFYRIGLLTLLLVLPALTHADDTDSYATATVQVILSEEQDDAAGFSRTVQTVQLSVESGPLAGEDVITENAILGERADMRLAVGDRVVLERIVQVDGTERLLIREPYRLPSLVLIASIFAALAMIFGGWMGLRSLSGLALSILVLTLFVVPAIGNGHNPLLVSFVGCIVIACTSLYLAHGFHRRTTIALLSTLTTLALALLFSIAAVQMAKLFGMGGEESMFLQLGPLQAVNLRGLLLGGIVIGALGVLDDITTAQTAVIYQLKQANRRLTQTQLYAAGLSVGREHIASLINTLALAYAGASLPLLLLFWSEANSPWWVILNNESIAEEIVRTLVGSAALVLAVPISTWFACRFITGHEHDNGHGHQH